MNKDVLIALIAKDVRELQTMTDGMDQMKDIPSQYLHLAHNKSKELTQNIDSLIEFLKEQEKQDALRKEEDKKETAKREAAEEAERQRKAEEIRAAQAALMEAQEKEKREKERRQAELAQKAEEEQRKAEQIRLEAEERQKAEERRAAELQKAEEMRHMQEEKERIALEEERKMREEKIRKAEEEYIKTKEESAIRKETENHRNEATVIEKPKQTVAESIHTSESLMDKLSKKEDNTLATALNNQKIADLKTAFSIADRFRFQRELFDGDGEEMIKALSDFNSFESIEEAQIYIEENFEWSEENSAVTDFMQLLHRRYL